MSDDKAIALTRKEARKVERFRRHTARIMREQEVDSKRTITKIDRAIKKHRTHKMREELAAVRGIAPGRTNAVIYRGGQARDIALTVAATLEAVNTTIRIVRELRHPEQPGR
jgi:hypothetical protein